MSEINESSGVAPENEVVSEHEHNRSAAEGDGDKGTDERIQEPDDRPESTAGRLSRVDDQAREGAGGEVAEPLPGVDSVVTVRQLQALIQEESFWSGPMPSPDTLDAYNRVHPGMSERIIKVYEAQTVDVSRREDKLSDAQIVTASRGQGWAIFLAVVCVGAAIFFFARGNNYAGSVFLGMPILALIGSFIPWRKSGD